MDGKIFKYFIIWNWICVSVIILTFLILNIYLNFTYGHFDLFQLFVYCCNLYFSCFDINVLYATVVMKLVSESFKKWISDLRNLKFRSDLLSDRYLNKMFDIFMDAFEAYRLTVANFRPLVSSYVQSAYFIGTLQFIKVIIIEFPNYVGVGFRSNFTRSGCFMTYLIRSTQLPGQYILVRLVIRLSSFSQPVTNIRDV